MKHALLILVTAIACEGCYGADVRGLEEVEALRSAWAELALPDPYSAVCERDVQRLDIVRAPLAEVNLVCSGRSYVGCMGRFVDPDGVSRPVLFLNDQVDDPAVRTWGVVHESAHALQQCTGLPGGHDDPRIWGPDGAVERALTLLGHPEVEFPATPPTRWTQEAP